ncbi:MAG TPA: HAD-IA family hydrolase, partial [Spirochaetia bacterium]|nr:HAD-IA family hydrolase [Spirochaetia bacterium]
DEATEVKDESGITLTADLIPGADLLLKELKARGYPLGLVADGFAETFRNVLSRHGLWELFDASAISELVGVEKPDPKIFLTALDQLGCPETGDRSRVVMVGNNLSRDIRGANGLGFTSVWLDWAPRRPKHPADDLERPDYVIRLPIELLSVLESLEG